MSQPPILLSLEPAVSNQTNLNDYTSSETSDSEHVFLEVYQQTVDSHMTIEQEPIVLDAHSQAVIEQSLTTLIPELEQDTHLEDVDTQLIPPEQQQAILEAATIMLQQIPTDKLSKQVTQPIVPTEINIKSQQPMTALSLVENRQQQAILQNLQQHSVAMTNLEAADESLHQALQAEPRSTGLDITAVLEKLKIKPSTDLKAIDPAKPMVAKQHPEMTATVGHHQYVAPTAKTEMPAPLLTTVQVPVNDSNWSQSVFDKVMWMSQQNQKVAQIQLNPADLGPLEIRVRMVQDQANVTFMAQHGQVRELVETALPRLREMFAEQGVGLGDVQVSDQSSRDSGASSEQQQERKQGSFAQGHQDEVTTEQQEESITVVRSGTLGIDSYV